jgi:preprotein translocase subunit YajC
VIIGASSGSGFIFIIVIGFLLVYLLFVRPQKRRQSQQQQMVNELRVGDEVLTAGGIYGTISAVDEDQVTVEIAPKTEVRVARRAIAGVTREPEADEADASEEPGEDGDEKWQSAFDDEGSGGDTSNEENRG